MNNTPFAGDKKAGQSLLGSIEKKFITAWTPRIPRWIETWHLTYATIAWSVLIVVFSFFAQHNIHWLWGVSAAIFLQWLTDAFDGAVDHKTHFAFMLSQAMR